MKPITLRKIGLIIGIISILVVWAFLYWLLCIPEPARPAYQDFTPQEKHRIRAAIRHHGNWPMEVIGDRIVMITPKGKVRI